MPGALNLPFGEVLEHGRLKPLPALREVIAAHGVDLEPAGADDLRLRRFSAAIVSLAVEEAGGKLAGLYDGSWSEWGAREDCPVATGKA